MNANLPLPTALDQEEDRSTNPSAAHRPAAPLRQSLLSPGPGHVLVADAFEGTVGHLFFFFLNSFNLGLLSIFSILNLG